MRLGIMLKFRDNICRKSELNQKRIFDILNCEEISKKRALGSKF